VIGLVILLILILIAAGVVFLLVRGSLGGS